MVLVGSTGTVLDGIGNTPLVELDGLWVKLEFLNPSGSVKARIARYMVEQAEESGLIRPGDTIVEASSGNTGNALSMVAAVKGYRMVVVMPRGLSSERVAISRAFGAELELTGNFHVNEAQARAAELAEQDGWWGPRQFDSEWNVEENRLWLGREILEGLPHPPDALVMGIGTGGTLIGVGQAMRAVNAETVLVGVEPDESCTFLCGEIGRHAIEGIADGFVPGIMARHGSMVDEFVPVESEAALDAMHYLARRHGMFVGPSSGANYAAAQDLRRQRPSLETVVTLFCDEGEKYISEHFS
ncbi:MAG TPA: cysteine synthase family protein [Acidimicrobiia bacterium]|nr:cysteine synthase family protein [Acidimicrobiia bacterium]